MVGDEEHQTANLIARLYAGTKKMNGGPGVYVPRRVGGVVEQRNNFAVKRGSLQDTMNEGPGIGPFQHGLRPYRGRARILEICFSGTRRRMASRDASGASIDRIEEVDLRSEDAGYSKGVAG